MSGDRDLTEGSLLRPFLLLSAPIVATQLLQVLYNLADTFWVGQLSTDAVTALSFAWPPIFVLIALGGGVTVAGSVLVAQHKGADNPDRVAAVTGQTVTVVSAFALLVGAAGYLATPTILSLLGATPGSPVFEMAREYMRIIFLGAWSMFAFWTFQSLLRGWGDTTTPMVLLAVGVGVNAVLLDPIFIFGFRDDPLFALLGLEGLERALYAATGFDGFGIEGAAVATLLARLIAAVPGLALLFSDRLGLSITLADLRPDPETVRKLVAVGYPASIEQTSGALSYSAMTAIIATISQPAVAAYGVSSRINSVVFLLAVGLGMGVETAVGQNLGAERADRARRVVFLAVAMVTTTYLALTVGAVTYARPLVGAFLTGEGAGRVVDLGAQFMYIVAPSWGMLGVFHVVKGCFNGAGSTRLAMALSMFTVWGLQVVPAGILIVWGGGGVAVAWWAVSVMQFGGGLLVTVWFVRDNWSDAVVESERPTPAD